MRLGGIATTRRFPSEKCRKGTSKMKLREYVDHDATGLASLVRAGEIAPSELTQLAREAHDDVNPRINAVIEFYEDAETVAGADGGLPWRAFPSQRCQRHRSRPPPGTRLPAVQGLSSRYRKLFFAGLELPVSERWEERRHRKSLAAPE